MASSYTSHYSVMLPECLEFAALACESSDKEHFKLADMTFGGGGHSVAFAKEFENVEVFSVDQDPDAFQNGLERIKLEKLEEKLKLVKMNFSEFPDWVQSEKPDLKFHGILLDLGVSSHHFDKFERGFSFREDAPLDMRMAYDQDIATAADVLNQYNEEEIADIIFQYGEERYSRRIAKAIVEERQKNKISTTKQLENICFHAYPSNLRHKKIHPATKTFQALRIFVNEELDVLENTLEKLFGLLDKNGVLMVISFHSLEDRITKHKFKEIFQCSKNTVKILTKKPVYPSEREVAENSRSRSAKLRVIQKLD
ncbi:MAG: 16S rRNA (cytosine(1402)-N(4))-methyltransferase [Halobacteriovoraceae bacterium]|nr:16S rRNA (cytosine(1402)-N(4))-methyltransferase [Halobacteriovoraceae bacterium]|tara:strand:+ start:1563 stop:2498 length:936 start_codon:yes stop_codon:yes gene_type:complete